MKESSPIYRATRILGYVEYEEMRGKEYYINK